MKKLVNGYGRIKEVRIEDIEELRYVLKDLQYYIENNIIIDYYNEIAFRMNAKHLKEMIDEGYLDFNVIDYVYSDGEMTKQEE